ncbi:MAG: PQQ-binding-like beta-propeller repeat protein [Acidobacteria bacterium]|nr:PQQ-binding-like beta-propeller repeat protein [Acidobacteriota bacterium]
MPHRRWIVLSVWGLAYAVALGVIWGRDVASRQDQVTATMAATVVALLACLVWFVVGSGLRRAVRVKAVLAIITAALVVVALFEPNMSGDLRPTLQSRLADNPEPVDDLEDKPSLFDFISTPGDSPEFLGPRRNGSFDTRLDPDWAASPPEEIWRRDVGAGWSSFAAVGNVAITQEQRGDMEALMAYKVDTGEVVWARNDPAHYESVVAGEGPRGTPTIWGDTVWAVGATGNLRAVELLTGKLRWSVNVIEDQGGRPHGWGFATSPLVYEDLVIVNGGSGAPNLVAYDRLTGEFRWSSDKNNASYASPQLARFFRRDYVIQFNGASISAHDPATGATVWETPWEAGQPNVAQPLQLGNLLVASSGYGRGAKLFGVRRGGGELRVETLWESPRLKAKFANFVQHEGYVYGLDDGVLTCIDPANGERVWKGGRYGHGQLLVSNGYLIVQAEDGSVVLVEATPEAHRELHRVPVFNRKTWNPPMLVGDVLLLRNDREAVALRLALDD